MIVRRKRWRNVYAMNLALRQKTQLDLDEGLVPRGCFGRMFTWSHGLRPHVPHFRRPSLQALAGP